MPIDNRRLPVPDDSKPPQSFAKTSVDRPDLTLAKRADGRAHSEMRPIFVKLGVVSQAKGSAYIELDKTKVICAVHGPREVAKREEFSMTGQLNCQIKLATFSRRKRVGHQQDSQEKDWSQVLQQALEPAVCMDKFPKARMDVFVTVLEDDGGALATAITCASAALANGNIEMYDIVIGSSLRQLGSHFLLDPSGSEEFAPQLNDSAENNASICVGYMPSIQQVSALVQSGQLEMSLAQEGIKLCVATCQRMFPIIQQALVTAVRSQKN